MAVRRAKSGSETQGLAVRDVSKIKPLVSTNGVNNCNGMCRVRETEKHLTQRTRKAFSFNVTCAVF
jgi:hypothetical protein